MSDAKNGILVYNTLSTKDGNNHGIIVDDSGLYLPLIRTNPSGDGGDMILYLEISKKVLKDIAKLIKEDEDIADDRK